MAQHIRDAVALGGVGAIAYGAWLIYQPAGFIAAGLLVVAGWAFAAVKGVR